MKGVPCEVCGLPRGRGPRCRACGYDRSSARSEASRARQASGTASQQTTQYRSPPRPTSSSGSRTTGSRQASSEAPKQPHSKGTPRPGRTKPSGQTTSGSPPEAGPERSGGASSKTNPHTYGWTTPPTVAGTVVSISLTPPARGDGPWWVAIVQCLAVVPGLAALMVLLTMRVVSRSVRRTHRGLFSSIVLLSSMPGQRFSPSPALAVGIIEAAFKNRAAMRAEYSMIRLRVENGEVACRYLAAPNILPVRRGDSLALWGPRKADGIIRGYKLENRSNGTTHTATLVRGWVYLAASVSALLCLMVLSNVALATGGAS
jgi:hypothetical protein